VIAEPDDWLSQLTDAPVMLMVSVPERRFAELPEPFQPKGIGGSASARILVSGSANEPVFSASFDARQVASNASRRAIPVDLHSTAQFELAAGATGRHSS